MNLTAIRSLGIGTAQQARAVADDLVLRQLLVPVGEHLFELPDAVRQRLTDQVTEQVGTKSGPSRDQAGVKSGLSPEQLSMISRMSGAHDIATLMEWTGRTNRSKFRQAVLSPLLTLGLVEMTIPDKPTSSKQCYRPTALGLAIQADQANATL